MSMYKGLEIGYEMTAWISKNDVSTLPELEALKVNTKSEALIILGNTLMPAMVEATTKGDAAITLSVNKKLRFANATNQTH